MFRPDRDFGQRLALIGKGGGDVGPLRLGAGSTGRDLPLIEERLDGVAAGATVLGRVSRALTCGE